MKHEHNFPDAQEEIDLREVGRAVWAGRWWVVAATSLAVLLGLVLALLLRNEYQVTAVLAPPSDGGRGGLGGLAGDLGGLAAIAGINLGSGGSSVPTTIATLQSNALIGDFIREEKLKPLLFPERWSVADHAWLPRGKPGLLAGFAQRIIDDPQQERLSRQPTLEPSDYEAVELFKRDVLSVSQDKKTDLVSVVVSWHDPVVASAWANSLVRRLNLRMRQDMMNDADKSLAYLQQEVLRTQELRVKEAIYGLMEAKLKSRMMASVSDEVAFRVIDSPVPPTKPRSPKRPLIVLMMGILGALLASGCLVVRHQMRERV